MEEAKYTGQITFEKLKEVVNKIKEDYQPREMNRGPFFCPFDRKKELDSRVKELLAEWEQKNLKSFYESLNLQIHTRHCVGFIPSKANGKNKEQ